MLEINKHCLNSNFELEINGTSYWRIISNRCHFECNQENWHLEADLLKQCSILMKCHTMKIGGWMMPTLLSHRFNTTIARQFEFLLWHSTLFFCQNTQNLEIPKTCFFCIFQLGELSNDWSFSPHTASSVVWGADLVRAAQWLSAARHDFTDAFWCVQ